MSYTLSVVSKSVLYALHRVRKCLFALYIASQSVFLPNLAAVRSDHDAEGAGGAARGGLRGGGEERERRGEEAARGDAAASPRPSGRVYNAR